MVTSTFRSHPSLHTLAPGAMFRQYRLLEQIGVGGQGVVWSALHPEKKQIYAIKFNEIPSTDEAEADDIRDEYQLTKLVTLRHPHILPMNEYGFEEKVRFIVTPYVAGGTLAERVKTGALTTKEILHYGAEVASALDYLHSQGIIHRDIKTSNILMNMSQNTYLADFGLARMVSTSTLAFHTGHGTPPYAPPEQIQMKAITLKSDIYSFGIVLYEMFTGQLPWNGKRQLGLEQTHSHQEIPDPRELNENLPSSVWGILRRATSATPGERPSSTGEIMRMLYQAFQSAPAFQPEVESTEDAIDLNTDAEKLLTDGLSRWESTNGTYNLGLTKFVMIDLHREKIKEDVYGRFMLSQAITYGYNDDQWWETISSLKERLLVSALLLGKNNEAITGRVIEHLTNDTSIRAHPKGLPKSLTTSLIDVGTKTDNVFLRQQIFEGIRTIARVGNEWDDQLLQPEQAKRLGNMAFEDSDVGDATAELIGHLHSSSAVQAILNHSNNERKFAVLLLIQKAAGNLPPGVQSGVRFRLATDWIIYRLTQRPVSLVGAYMLAFLGVTLGTWVQVYFTYNLPNFLDTARFVTALEQGLIIGAVFGLGIFLSRVIVERFSTSNALLRVIIGAITGTLGINAAMLTFHILFLNTSPQGFLITASCALIAFTFALGSLIQTRLIRMMLASIAVFVAVAGSWWFHINTAASSLDLTPVFRYDYAWSLTQVALVALGVSIPIGIFGNLIDLSIVEE